MQTPLRCQIYTTIGLRDHHADLCKLFFCLICRYVRLELLQGVAAFHSGDSQASLHLASALAKWQRLQVSDESLATLASMGFTASQVQTISPAVMPTVHLRGVLQILFYKTIC